MSQPHRGSGSDVEGTYSPDQPGQSQVDKVVMTNNLFLTGYYFLMKLTRFLVNELLLALVKTGMPTKKYLIYYKELKNIQGL